MSETTVSLDGHVIEVSRREKVLFPGSGQTKGDLVDYYRRIADTALPHLRGRPLSMRRFPDGIGGEGFFQKDVPDYFPDWIARTTLEKEGGDVTHVVVENAATLAYLANQGCITLHVGLSRVDAIDRPDRIVFDLDPPGHDFSAVRDAACRLKDLCDTLDLPSFVQTSGSRGLHVVVPLEPTAGFDAARRFARAVAERLAEHHPDQLTVETRKDKRKGRLFIDYLRNAYGQTAVAPYSVRAIETAPVATPLDWDEISRADLTAQTYTIDTLFRRLGQKDDPWRHIDKHRADVRDAEGRLKAL